VLEAAVGSVVWILANVMYRAYVRDGETGFKRFAAFWLGFPYTILSNFVVPRPRSPRDRSLPGNEAEDAEEERDLLREIREDRLLRRRTESRRDDL
jgi:hypothetical protein